MITLKDYIGTIYKEITNAKVQSDIETLAVAQEYLKNPYLKHFSVPNVRMKNLEITVPIGVENIDQVTSQQEVSYDISKEAFYNTYTKVYGEYFKDEAASIPVVELDKATEAGAQYASELMGKIQVAIDKEAAASDIKATEQQVYTKDVSREAEAIRAVSNQQQLIEDQIYDFSKYIYINTFNTKEANFDAFSAYVASVAKKEFGAVMLKVGSIPVIVESSRLKEVTESNLMKIKMHVFEDSMEWIVDTDADGTSYQTLTYE